MSGSSSFLFLSSLMKRIRLNDRGEEKRDVEHQLREREGERERENLNEEWECWVGLIFWVCVCLFLCLFFKKNKYKFSNKGKYSTCFCV